MTTARTLIKKALLEIGALTKSEEPSDDEANDGLDTLNALLSSWSNFSANIYSRTQETFPLTSAASYLIGDGQVFNTTRPIQIIDAYVTLGTIDYPLELINQELYDDIAFKANQGIPQFLTYNNGYPYGKITLYPVPVSVTSVTILSEKAITNFPTLDTLMVLPEGWERAIIKNLAIELASQYSQPVTPVLEKAAQKSLGAIKLAVVRSRPVEVNPVIVRGNVYNGWMS